MLTKLVRTSLFHNLDYKSGCESPAPACFAARNGSARSSLYTSNFLPKHCSE